MYPSFVVAEVLKSRGSDEGFSTLARYIGVFGDPANEKKQPMAMTAPVTLTPARSQKMAMTAPVTLTSSPTAGMEYMGFVLPFDIQTLEQAPTPLDKRVRLRLVPPRLIAVRTFSGWFNDAVGKEHYKTLHKGLVDSSLVPSPSPSPSTTAIPKEEEEEQQYEISQYHPPFTLPFLRRNEVWVELQQSLPVVKKLLLDALAKTK